MSQQNNRNFSPVAPNHLICNNEDIPISELGKAILRLALLLLSLWVVHIDATCCLTFSESGLRKLFSI